MLTRNDRDMDVMISDSVAVYLRSTYRKQAHFLEDRCIVRGKTIVWTRLRFTSPDHNSFPNRIVKLCFSFWFRRSLLEEDLPQRCRVLVPTAWHTRPVTSNHIRLLGRWELRSHGRSLSHPYDPRRITNKHGYFVLGLIRMAGEK